jgi:hypothetical protein
MKRRPTFAKAFSGEQWACPHCAWTPRWDGDVMALAPQAGVPGDGFDPSYFAQLFQRESSSFRFGSVTSHARHDLLRVPYTHVIIEAQP